ncbi:MAG TPA: SMP-30/gluconolactonase/LRE family protein [Acidimicrobiales bacterium]|nr:SMP-30/gluconolactonase/LRE family protein [Acidimicrobiales bacterium]
MQLTPLTADLAWGESTTWDDRRQRLCFVDCATSNLHWLDADSTTPESWTMPSLPTGIVPTEDGRLIVVLDDGLNIVDVDSRTIEHLAPNPPGVDRCNDACADLEGNVITGKLNLGPAEGSAWRWSPADSTWSLLDDDIANTNGPCVDAHRLVIGDTSAQYWAYDYDGRTATNRRLAGSTDGTGGHPDGATLDADGHLWAAVFGSGTVVRFGADAAPDLTIPVGYENPSDVTFGGPDLDRLFVAIIGGPLLAIDGLDARGRVEPRARL